MNKPLCNTICYEELATGNTFLAYYVYKSDEEAQAEVDRLNNEKPEKLFNGLPAKCNERRYFVHKQEPMY